MESTEAIDYQRLKEAFNELIEATPEARVARLAEMEAEAPEFAQRLRQQLASIGKSLPLLDRVAANPAAPVLERYTILRELGRGGMGVVWLAERDVGGIRLKVAIKQVAGFGIDRDDPRRFERERRILAGLEHPNIAALLDGGTDTHGQAFFATQFVDGERLDKWCEKHAPDARSRIMLLRDIVSAVAYAHRNLVVHRDLKPANILVTRDGQAKLLDFGIARALDDDPLTSDGQSQMTLRYAAPEQVANDGGEKGVSVDIYALGVLMYEMLAQAPMYRDANGTAALIHAILNETPVAPSKATVAITGADADLDAICLRALRKRPIDRYGDASSLLADLDRWLAHAPVEARRGERGYLLRSFIRRRWVAIAASLIVLAGVGYHLVAQQQQLAEVERQRDRAQALASHFADLFDEATPRETESGDVSAVTLLERSVKRLEEDKSRPALTRAALLIASADALSALGHSHEEENVSRLALALAGTVEPRDGELLASAHAQLSGALLRNGNAEAALRESEAGLALFESADAHDPLRRNNLILQAATQAQTLGNVSRARAHYEKIVELTRDNLGNRELLKDYLAAQINLATTVINSNPRESSDRLQEALNLAAKHGLDSQDVLLPMRMYLGTALYHQHRLPESREVMEKVLVDARAFYGSNDLWRAMMLTNVGVLFVLDGEPERGDVLLAEAHTIVLGQVGPENLRTRALEVNQSIAKVMTGHWHDAQQRIDPILEWMVANGQAEKPMTQYLRIARAYVEARIEPTPEHLAKVMDATKANTSWRTYYRWTSDDWAQWARSQQR